MSSVSIRLPDDVSVRLQNLVELTGRSKTLRPLVSIWVTSKIYISPNNA